MLMILIYSDAGLQDLLGLIPPTEQQAAEAYN